jgi:acetyltransferase-like isoleucine patch superfamily enzyme
MQNQLRAHLKYNFFTFIRYLYWKSKLNFIGKKVYIERNVRFLRFRSNINISDNVVIKEGARICACNKDAKLSVGENTTLGYHNFYFASSEIKIGKNCLLAPFVYIVDSNHRIAKNGLINEQANESAPIIIGNDVWIASNVTILKGVTIGDGAVIGAHSLVNKDIEPYSIVAGLPIKKIGMRE